MALVHYIVSLFGQWWRPKSSKELGEQAERLAAIYLRLKGYKIVSQNWRTRWGEIDLIAKDQDTLVFVEVKARSSFTHGQPEEAITLQKRQKLLTLAKVYLANHPKETDVRFDVIAIDFLKSRPQIRHYKGAIEE